MMSLREAVRGVEVVQQVDVYLLGDSVLYAEAMMTLLVGEPWVSTLSVATTPGDLVSRPNAALPAVLLINCRAEYRSPWIRSAVAHIPGVPVVALGVERTEDEILRLAE